MTDENINSIPIPMQSAWKAVPVVIENNHLGTEEFDNNISLTLQQFKYGDMLNLYQDMIVKSKWDVRDCNGSPSLLLGRNHMFYKNKELSNEQLGEIILSDETSYSEVEKVFENNVIDIIYNLYNTDIAKEPEAKKEITLSEFTENEDMDIITRNTVRKFSENHFAISSYNLIDYEISINNDIPNAVFSQMESDEDKKYITILSQTLMDSIKHTDGNKVKDQNFIPPFAQLNTEESFFNKFRNSEYLATQLLKAIELSYQGKIFITFNDDIEIGDRITLFDNTNATFGIFEIDAFEHSFDEKRGVVTCLFVKSSVDLVDPFLDKYYYSIAYEMIEDFKTELLRQSAAEYTITSNIKIKNIFGLYTKHLVQGPKYTPIIYYDSEPFKIVDPDKIIDDFNIPIPLRFMPYVKKGKFLAPSTIEASFFDSNNIYKNIFEQIMANMQSYILKTVDSIGEYGKNLGIWLADNVLGMITMNLSDILKPILGITSEAAQKQMINKIYNEDNTLAKLMTEYNSYDGIYNLGRNYGLTLCFFNVQAQKVTNMFPSDKVTFTDEEFLERYNIKTASIKKIITDTFDCAFLVELYESFKYKNYNINNFVKDVTPTILESSSQVEHLFNQEKYGAEYGCSITKGPVQIESQKTIELTNKRSAVETTINIQHLKIKDIERVKIIWFHNIYGETSMTSRNTLQERKDNVTKVLNTYEGQIDEKTAIVIMADFNLVIVNYNELPKKTTGSENNAVYELPKNSKFSAKIKFPTTLNKLGKAEGNIYDNVIISRNLVGKVDAGRFNYSMEKNSDRVIISDHIPVYLGFKKQ